MCRTIQNENQGEDILDAYFHLHVSLRGKSPNEFAIRNQRTVSLSPQFSG